MSSIWEQSNVIPHDFILQGGLLMLKLIEVIDVKQNIALVKFVCDFTDVCRFLEEAFSRSFSVIERT